MINFKMSFNNRKLDFAAVLRLYNSLKHADDKREQQGMERLNGGEVVVLNYIATMLKCDQDTAELIYDEVVVISNWYNNSPNNDPPLDLLRSLFDSGLIDMNERYKLEKKLKVSGGSHLQEPKIQPATQAQFKESSQIGQRTSYAPRCPVCGSPHIKKISSLLKYLDFKTAGMNSATFNKQMQCRSCGYMF